VTVPHRAALLVCLVFAANATVVAHDVSQSISQVTVEGRAIRVRLSLDGIELRYLDMNGDDRLSFAELDRVIDRVYADVTRHYVVRGPGSATHTTLERYDVVDNHAIDLELAYVFEAAVTTVTITSTLEQLTRPGHRHLTSVTGLGGVRQAVIGGNAGTASFAAEPRSTMSIGGEFLTLGLEHIVTGYDHLAFLVGLVLASTTLLSLAKVITFFTIAHSMTLALATFDLVVMPPRLIESLIAASIGYLALESLFRATVSKPYLVTFLFGLVHGFGFSNILREMDLPQGLKAVSLFSFNVGVEIGQLAFVLVMFPVIGLLRDVKLPIRQTISVCLLGLALYWFAERAFSG